MGQHITQFAGQQFKISTFKLGRFEITKGDVVKVESSPGRKDSFRGTVMGATVAEDGSLLSVDVYGARGGKALAIRTFTPDRITYTRPTSKVAASVREKTEVGRSDRAPRSVGRGARR